MIEYYCNNLNQILSKDQAECILRDNPIVSIILKFIHNNYDIMANFDYEETFFKIYEKHTFERYKIGLSLESVTAVESMRSRIQKFHCSLRYYYRNQKMIMQLRNNMHILYLEDPTFFDQLKELINSSDI